jgi:selenide,water dikinase
MTAPRLLLLGAGLPHLVVLEALARQRRAAGSVMLVAGEPVQPHPGMVPGFIAGRYTVEDVRVDLAQAAQAAGAELVVGQVDSLDASTRVLQLEGGRSIAYDIASIALDAVWSGDAKWAGPVHSVGSLSRAQALAEALDQLAAAPRPEPRRIVILGASELGVELALATRTRLDRRGANDVVISMLESRSELFGGRLPPWAERVEKVLAERDIILRLGTGATEVGVDFVRLSDGRVQPADLVLGAPGPMAWTPLRGSGLPLDGHGFLILDDTLQVQGHSNHFGAGPGTALVSAPRSPNPPLAQLRMGRVLSRNLLLALTGNEPGRQFHSKDRELTLLDAGDGRAVLLGGPVATVSRLALKYKQMGDRRLVARLRAGPPGGTPTVKET